MEVIADCYWGKGEEGGPWHIVASSREEAEWVAEYLTTLYCEKDDLVKNIIKNVL